MRSRRRIPIRLVCLEERTVPANILEVEPIWINPAHIREFTPDGTLVGQITASTNDLRDVVVSPDGKIQLFEGTFSPKLSTYDPATETWSSRTTAGWSTVNNLSYGGIAAYGDWVYVTDMQTAYETAPFNGIIRFNMADDTVERFAGGRNFIALTLGLDGFIYALGGQTGMGNNVYKYDPISMAELGSQLIPLGDVRGVAVGANGDYYVSDHSGSGIHRYDSGGNHIRAQSVGGSDVDVSLDGQVIAGSTIMDLELNVVGTFGAGCYHTGFATPQIPILTPILKNVEQSALSYAENAPATPVSDTIELTDSHSTTLVGATIAIVASFSSGEDVLSFVDANGISGTYNASTGVLTLSGTASLADYQAALRGVLYQNTSDDPSTASRQVRFQVDDGRATNNLSNTLLRAVDITADNDAPAITLPVNEPVGHADQGMSVAGIVVTDVDARGSLARLLVSVPDGELFFTELSSVAVVDGANHSATIEIEGTIAGLNQALADGNFNFQPAPGFTGDVVLSLTLNDQGNTGSGGAQSDSKDLTIHINPALPRLALVAAGPLPFREGTLKRRVAQGMKLTAGNATIAEARVAITDNYHSGEDVLSLPARPRITGNFDPSTGVLTLSGTATVGQYRLALRAVRYSNTSRNPSTDLRVVSFQVNDGVPGNAWSNAVTRSIQLRAANTAPVLTLPTTVLTTAKNTGVAINGITLADADSNGGLARLTLRVTRGTITFVNPGSVTILQGANGSRAITLVGTLAELNAILVAGNLLYQPPTDYVGAATLQLKLNDLGSAGIGGPRVRHGSVRVRMM